jgi:hypothetical protein
MSRERRLSGRDPAAVRDPLRTDAPPEHEFKSAALWSSPLSRYRLKYLPAFGNSYKLAMMLALCGKSFEPVCTDFASWVTLTPKWRREVNAVGD